MKAVFYEGSIEDVWFVGETGKNVAQDWEFELTDFFVVIPNTTFLMFRLQMGIALPAESLKKFVVEKWGGDLDNPKLYFKSSEFEDEVGNFSQTSAGPWREAGKTGICRQ